MSVWKDTCRLSKGGSVAGMGAAAFVGLIVLTGLVAPATCNPGSGGYPGSDELVSRFRAHEREFAVLAEMLAADRGAFVDIRGPIALDASRRASYEDLLGKIGVADLRYVPGSGEIAVWVSDVGVPPSTHYLYTSTEHPARSVRSAPARFGGPGLYFITRDQPLAGGWFLRHEVSVPVCVFPY
jgi:hypothetical protein